MASSIVPLVVIVGETASGKSDIGLQLAQQFSGEIICADSRTVYKYMDIGTAKPNKIDQTLIPHHVIDVVEPGEPYNAAQFKQDALAAINEIASRNKLPIMVGGTGLYVDAVIFDYQFAAAAEESRREYLNALNLEELQNEAKNIGIAPEQVNFKNRRHLQRAIEIGGVVHEPKQLRPNTLVMGIARPRDDLRERIENRVDSMIQEGFIDEVKRLHEKYGTNNESMTGIGYKAFAQYIEGKITLEDAKQQFIRGDLSLAKRQRTWFKRNKSVHWVDDPRNIVDIVTTFLNNSPV